MESCSFCQKFNDPNGIPKHREWFDKVLMEDEHFVATSALGQLVEGYLMVIPRLHVPSAGSLNKETFELFLIFAQKVQDAIAGKYGRSVIFEHGSLGNTKRAGCCVNHAHWHLVPFNLNPLPMLEKDKYIGGPINNPRQLRNLSKTGTPYLFFKNQLGGMWLYQAPTVPSQLFRRILAIQIGKEGEWDYSVFPFEENLKQTISTLGILGENLNV